MFHKINLQYMIVENPAQRGNVEAERFHFLLYCDSKYCEEVQYFDTVSLRNSRYFGA